MFSSRKSAVLRCASSSVLHTLSCCSMSKNISFTWHWLWFVQKTRMLKKNTTSKTWHSTTSWPPTSITFPFIVNLKYPAHFGKSNGVLCSATSLPSPPLTFIHAWPRVAQTASLSTVASLLIDVPPKHRTILEWLGVRSCRIPFLSRRKLACVVVPILRIVKTNYLHWSACVHRYIHKPLKRERAHILSGVALTGVA